MIWGWKYFGEKIRICIFVKKIVRYTHFWVKNQNLEIFCFRAGHNGVRTSFLSDTVWFDCQNWTQLALLAWTWLKVRAWKWHILKYLPLTLYWSIDKSIRIGICISIRLASRMGKGKSFSSRMSEGIDSATRMVWVVKYSL